MDFKTVTSERFVTETENFNFDIPIAQLPTTLLHADELFSDGLIKPVFLNPASSCNTSDFILELPRSCSFSSRNTAIPTSQHHYHVLKKWRKSSNKIMQKCFGYLRRHCNIVGSSRKSNNIDRRAREAKSWSNSPQSSPQQSTTHILDDSWSVIENSIYEAVLHCKRSIEKESRKGEETGKL